MRLLFVVQRYGEDVNGGAEQHCRWLAEGLSERGHCVTVATSCARDYMTWRNVFDAGSSVLNGVRVERFQVACERDVSAFNELSHEVFTCSSTLEKQAEWLLAQGPRVDSMRLWLRENRHLFDVAIVFTYLYYTTQMAVDELAGHLPLVMHATAHDEAPFHLPIMFHYLSRVDEFLCSSDEEASLLRKTVGPHASTTVVGVGVSLARPKSLSSTLLQLGAPLKPYFLLLGRIDENKGTPAAVKSFLEYRAKERCDIELILAGENVARLPTNPGLTFAGFVSEEAKSTLLHGAIALFHPSHQESFSLALHEAWLAGTPAIVNEACAVTAIQTKRSAGGLVYGDEKSLHDALNRMRQSLETRLVMGRAGQAFVINNYVPSAVLSHVDQKLSKALTTKR